MNDLFSAPLFAPLAARLRPKTLTDYVGQAHLMGENRPLRMALEQEKLHSMILWGPPGTGKTTLAELIATQCRANVIRLSAVTAGVKDIRAAIDQAKSSGLQTVLFVDEVHRFNKSQQDAFLPFIEDGTIHFIGATTENPSFSLNYALLSRLRVYVLERLDKHALEQMLDHALADTENGLGATSLQFEAAAKNALIELSAGDGRRMLNNLERCADLAADQQVTLEIVEKAVGQKIPQFDKQGDAYYDVLSAFHKSVRGSSPDAAVYWFSRLLVAGGDPLAIARRLLAIASEDIGNADPRALQVCLNAWDIFHRVGPAEGERAIAQAAIYCACAAKSNAVYQAFNAAKHDAQQYPDFAIPLHLRNAPTELMKQQGFGEGYRYAHNEEHAYAAGEVYLPVELKDKTYYQPSERGLEKQIKAKLDTLAQWDNASGVKRYD